MRFIDDIQNRILILDGAMGSMLQAGLGEEDVLRSYVKAGADIITTNSFNANRLVQMSTGLADRAAEMALEAARRARKIADEAEASGKKVYVAGSVGPTGKSLSLASDASDATYRQYGFADMRDAFKEQMDALRKGGADLILLETCFDALNAKAAICALEELGNPLPLVISATVSDASERTLTGQTLEAFYRSVEHAPGLAAFGINCALGAEKMASLLTEIAGFSHHPTIFYPNAGIPDELGIYRDSPALMARVMDELAGKGLLNIAGGCCGTTDRHIAAIAKVLEGRKPHQAKEPDGKLHVSGLESVCIDPSLNFTNVGERTNVAGSRKFARLIAAKDYAAATDVASAQVEGGARIIDINMDDPMLDAPTAMRDFLRHISCEPAVAKAAVMIDSSNWETIVEGLQNAQGKCIVNSISLRDGEQLFLEKARTIRNYGAAMVVMAFDEQGQAVTFERKTEICARSYRLLTEAGIPPQEIIFDCNILSIGTGIPEHARFGVDFIEAVRWIKANLPGARTSGGVSNLSFAFRGNNRVREAMHSAFLYHAVKAGLDMAIVNPQMLQIYDDIDPELRRCVEDVIFDADPEATSRLVRMAADVSRDDNVKDAVAETPSGTPSERLKAAVVKGGSPTLREDAEAAIDECGGAIGVIEGPLMAGMEHVGELFSDGRMFLPQVVKSAKVMRDAVDVLKPHMPAGAESGSKPRFLIATVQGDVHDIGKNITSIVLQCSGFEVTDLGVMVPCDEILDKAQAINADIIGVSGLITPSLQRMEEICAGMAGRGMDIPLFVGGAATSAVHTAVKLAPIYPNVHYGADASATAVSAKKYLQAPDAFIEAETAQHEKLASLHRKRESGAVQTIGDGYLPGKPFNDTGLTSLSAEELMPHFDWKLFGAVCGVKGELPENLKDEALAFIRERKPVAVLAARFFDCHREGDDIVCAEFTLPMLRDKCSLADFIPENGSSQMGVFAACVRPAEDGGLTGHAVEVCLAEAASEHFRKSLALPDGMKLITPGIGYPCCPDHSLKRDLLALLPSGLGIELTDSCAMIPEASVCGLAIAHKDAFYPYIRQVDAGQLDIYAGKRGMNEQEKKLFLGNLI